MSKPLIQISHLSKTYGSTKVLDDICLDVYPGEFLTLLGPSGCGKTTLLRLISGFEAPTSGEIHMKGQCINHLPPQKRDVHTVFQSYALFPHLTVFENTAFALRCQKIHNDEINQRVIEALALVQLESFADRAIKQLSGGQQQRVAIARAIIARPTVLLLDEPLSSLDYRLRKAMQYELKQLQKTLNITFVFVTHDQEEALSMSDRIVVFNHGKVEQIGTPRDIYETPNNLYVAQFIGETNVFVSQILKQENDEIEVDIESIALKCKNTGHYQTGQKINLVIRPEDIRVWGEAEVTNSEGMLPGTIIDIIYKGSTVDVKVKLSSGRMLYASEFFDEDDDKLEYTIGEKVWAHWLAGWEVLLPYED